MPSISLMEKSSLLLSPSLVHSWVGPRVISLKGPPKSRALMVISSPKLAELGSTDTDGSSSNTLTALAIRGFPDSESMAQMKFTAPGSNSSWCTVKVTTNLSSLPHFGRSQGFAFPNHHLAAGISAGLVDQHEHLGAGSVVESGTGYGDLFSAAGVLIAEADLGLGFQRRAAVHDVVQLDHRAVVGFVVDAENGVAHAVGCPPR